MTSRDAVGAGAARAGEDSRALREGMDHVVVGTMQCDAVEVPPATELTAEEKRGTPAMYEGGGSDPVGGALLVPVQDKSR